MPKHHCHRNYLAVVGTLILGLCVLGLGVNLLVDPLMFTGGNRLFDRNYVFNERLSKVAYYRGREPELECLILGSSRMTFLDARAVFDGGCANYAFSGGRPGELLSYLYYLRAMGANPARVVVGVDVFGVDQPGEGVPDFVSARSPMGGPLAYYFSLDSLRYSVQTLTGSARSPNFYDRTLRKHVGYPLREAGKEYPGDGFYVDGQLQGRPEVLAVYEEMTRVFPEAEWVALVPPVSRWARLRLTQNAVAAAYASALHHLAGPFDRLYDFSWLPDECMDYTDSYDGIHYSARVWDRYAQRLTDMNDPDLVKGAGRVKPVARMRADYMARAHALSGHGCSSDRSARGELARVP